MGGKKEAVQGGEGKRFLMKVCPECRTKNDDLNHFCKKCGFLLTRASFKEGKEKVFGRQKRFPWVLLSLLLVGLVLGGVAFWIIRGKLTTHSKTAVHTKVRHEKIPEGMKH